MTNTWSTEEREEVMTSSDPKRMRRNSSEAGVNYGGCGVDPESLPPHLSVRATKLS